MSKTFKSKVKYESYSSLVIFIILVLFMYFLDELTVKSFSIFFVIAIVLSRFSIDETLYTIVVDEVGIKVIKNRFPASKQKYELSFKNIKQIEVKRGGSGSMAKTFKIFCPGGEIRKFKLVNTPEIIDELIEIFKAKDIIIEDKRT